MFTPSIFDLESRVFFLLHETFLCAASITTPRSGHYKADLVQHFGNSGNELTFSTYSPTEIIWTPTLSYMEGSQDLLGGPHVGNQSHPPRKPSWTCHILRQPIPDH
ncbi:hypothetical protein KC19_1G094300 [Ceratodon purpureus]|uniref:Uncharacterized protein n=1 Tax=Ceratodon purpureus TaxID=3225 RepID=A0A8T0J6E2_CERPU|nr:hypothetical protein KC19_1G094300 [Ceratodon purpureus]